MADELLTEYEQRREHRLDKFLDHLDPTVQRVLDDTELKYLELMRKAFHWQAKFFSPEDARKMLMNPDENGGKAYSYQMACQIFADSEYLFGKLKDLDKTALRKKLTEQLFKANQMAIQDNKATGLEKAELVSKNVERLAKLHNLYTDSGELDPDVLMQPRVVIFNMDNRSVQVNNIDNGEGGNLET